MNKKIFKVMLALVLVLSFSLVTAAPTAATDGGTFNNPDYFYKRLLDTGDEGVRWPDYNPIAGKITWYQGSGHGYFADYNSITLELTNITSLATEGVYVYGSDFSKDGQYIIYQDVAHMTSLDVTGGTVDAYLSYRYNIVTDSTELIFDISTIPATTIEALTDYVGSEFGFYLGPGGSNNEVLMCVRDGNGQMDIVSYNIADKTFINLTNSEQAEYDGGYFGTDTSQLLYWTESYPTHADRSVAILSGGVETVIDMATYPDMYLTARWGEDQNHVMAMQGTGWSSNDLVMFTKNGGVWSGPEDLTGDAWSATDGGLNVGAWVDNGFIFSVRNSAGNSANGLWVAMLPADEVWVDDDWTGLSPGDSVDGHTFGYDAFATIQDGVDSVAGSVVYVAEGVYTEAVNITPGANLTIQGAGRDVTTWMAPADDASRMHCIMCRDANNTTLDISGFTFSVEDNEISTSGIAILINRADDGPLYLNIHDNKFVDTTEIPDETANSMLLCHNRFAARIDGIAPVNIYNNLDYTTGGIAMSNSQAFDIYNNTFNGCSDALYIGYGCPTNTTVGDHHIFSNTFRDASNTYPDGPWPSIFFSYYGSGTGVVFLPSIIERNIFEDNDVAIGYSMESEIVYPSDIIRFNNFNNNTEAMRVFGTHATTVNAEYNWWGHASGPSGPDGRVNNKGKVIGKGDAILGNVDWDPYLPQPVGHTKHDPVPPGLR